MLGVGSGGKAVMNQALGIAGRSYADFAAQWVQLRVALRGQTSNDAALHLPTAYRPPPVYLASSDVRRWQAIEGDADGWQTFLTDDRRQLDDRHTQVCAVRGGVTPTDLRLDVELVPMAASAVGAAAAAETDLAGDEVGLELLPLRLGRLAVLLRGPVPAALRDERAVVPGDVGGVNRGAKSIAPASGSLVGVQVDAVEAEAVRVKG